MRGEGVGIKINWDKKECLYVCVENVVFLFFVLSSLFFFLHGEYTTHIY